MHGEIIIHGVIRVSGYNDNWRGRNIYDLAGNLWEWSSERFDVTYVIRGGECTETGSDYPVTFRINGVPGTTTSDALTFRVVLYVN